MDDDVDDDDEEQEKEEEEQGDVEDDDGKDGNDDSDGNSDGDNDNDAGNLYILTLTLLRRWSVRGSTQCLPTLVAPPWRFTRPSRAQRQSTTSCVATSRCVGKGGHCSSTAGTCVLHTLL